MKTLGYTKGSNKGLVCIISMTLLLALALLADMLFVPQAAASPNQATFYSSASDGYLESGGYGYSTVHGASSGSVLTVGDTLYVGQVEPIESYFWIYRSALFFDTSSLPDDATISSAVLSLYGSQDSSIVDFEITAVDGSVLHEPLVGADYGALRNQTVSGGAFDTSGFSVSGYNDIPLNETGMGWISKTAITKLGLRSSRDIAPTEPHWDERVDVYTFEKGGGYQPKLVVTYTIPVGGEIYPVGGKVYPVNKISLLIPWLGLVLAILVTDILLVGRRAFRSKYMSQNELM